MCIETDVYRLFFTPYINIKIETSFKPKVPSDYLTRYQSPWEPIQPIDAGNRIQVATY